MKRIQILGSSGAGKSTLARHMGELLGLKVYHLDAWFWQPGWVQMPREQWETVQQNIIEQETWIIDGNYSHTLQNRLALADTIILLDFPRTLCMARALKRIARYYGETRPDMADGCKERIDFEFLRYVWDFPKKVFPQITTMLAELPDSVTQIRIDSREGVEAYLKELRARTQTDS